MCNNFKVESALKNDKYEFTEKLLAYINHNENSNFNFIQTIKQILKEAYQHTR